MYLVVVTYISECIIFSLSLIRYKVTIFSRGIVRNPRARMAIERVITLFGTLFFACRHTKMKISFDALRSV